MKELDAAINRIERHLGSGKTLTKENMDFLIKEIRKSQKELLDFKKVTSGIMHDVKNVTMQIKSITDYMAENLDKKLDLDFIRTVTPEIKKSIDRATSDILKFINISTEHHKRDISNKRDIVDIYNTIDVFYKSRKLDVEIHENLKFLFESDFKKDELFSLINEINLNRILYNLVNNAIDHTKSGYIKISLKGDDDYIYLNIEDTGEGISDKDKDKIFNDFFSTKKDTGKNYGMGLSIVKELVDGSNGEISLESFIGKGSIFKIKIRRYKKAIIKNKEDLSILYLDDEFCNRIVLERDLSDYDVDVCETKEDLFEKISQKTYHLFVIDFNLSGDRGPNSKGSFIAKNIKTIICEKNEHAKFVCISGLSEDDVTIEDVDEFDLWIEKPINKFLLIESINKLFNIE